MINGISYLSVFEVIFRTIVIFTSTIIILKLRGAKKLSQLNVLDAVLVIALGSALGDVMVYSEKDVSLLRAIIAIATIVIYVTLIQFVIARLPKKIIKKIHGEAVIIVKNGKLHKKNLLKLNLSEDELKSKMSEFNVKYYSQIRLLKLETNGEISIERLAKKKEEEKEK
jgi:uncharacterized membrane protein YcaP (DUF421 family)